MGCSLGFEFLIISHISSSAFSPAVVSSEQRHKILINLCARIYRPEEVKVSKLFDVTLAHQRPSKTLNEPLHVCFAWEPIRFAPIERNGCVYLLSEVRLIKHI